MSSTNSKDSMSPTSGVSMSQQQQQHQLQQLLQQVNDPQQLANLNQFQIQQQQYQQMIQQQNLANSNGQLMASPMGLSNNSSSMGYDLPTNSFSYQQSVLHYFQLQQQQQQLQQQQQQHQLQLDPYLQQPLLQPLQLQLFQNQVSQQQLQPLSQQVNIALQPQQQQSQVAVPQLKQQQQQQQQQQQLPIPLQYIPQISSTQFAPSLMSNISPHIPSSIPVQNVVVGNRGTRKRQRRSDHALPGDEGDSELKEMALKAFEMPFEEYAAQVRQVEFACGNSSISSPCPPTTGSANGSGGSSSRPLKEEESTKERKRQVFGMVCLMKLCQECPNAVVPRSKIYSSYTNLCNSTGVHPLSAASFGKLVRILYPSITTRRLGMRGQSKYHYCGIRLLVDELSPTNSPSGQTPMGSPFTTPRTVNSLEGTNSPLSIVSRTSSIANMNQTFIGTSHSTSPATLDTTDFKHLIIPNLKFNANLYHDLLQQQQLSPTELNNGSTSSTAVAGTDFLSLNLPSLQLYTSATVDRDVVITLDSLYKSHCRSIFECLRYMHLTDLFNHVSSFAFSLTLPVYKLYISEEIQPWILECDIKTYQAVIKMLSTLALQKIPPKTLSCLQEISRDFTEKYQNALKKLPIEFIKLKLKPVENFSRLISRLVNVSNSSISATKILLNSDERIKVLTDWQKCNFKDIIEKGPPCSENVYIERVMTICTKEVPTLLEYDPNVELMTEELSPSLKMEKLHNLILQKWTNYLVELPANFSTLSPRIFLLCLSSLLTTTLREMTLLASESFGAWWILRCWVDDWMGWCAEMTGFLELNSSSSLLQDRGRNLQSAKTLSNSRHSSIQQQQQQQQNNNSNTINNNEEVINDSNNENTNDTNSNNMNTNAVSPYIKDELLDIQNQELGKIDLFNI